MRIPNQWKNCLVLLYKSQYRLKSGRKFHRLSTEVIRKNFNLYLRCDEKLLIQEQFYKFTYLKD